MPKKREDITTADVARRWIAGETIEDIALSYEAALNTVKRRLTAARHEFPGLARDSRVVRRDHGAVKRYTQMTDGQGGESVLRAGSVVRSRKLRKR